MLYSIILVFKMALAHSFAAPAKFVHPGTVLTKEQMTYAYSQAMAGKQPWKRSFYSWKGQFALFLDSGYVPNGKTEIARTRNKWAYENDAMAMFANGVMWNMTGEDRYGRKTVQLLNSWDTLCCSFPDGTDFALMFGYGLQFMVYGADLIHDYGGFSDAERLRAKSFLKMLNDRAISSYTQGGHYPYVGGGWPSWGSGLGRFLMAYAVYADDSAAYDAAKSYFFRSGSQGGDNGTVMTAFLDNGEELEMGRDIYYAQLSLGSFLEWSRIAFNQGDTDLFAARDGVLGKAMEYLAAYNRGDSVTWVPFPLQAPVYMTGSPVGAITSGNRGAYRNIWHLAYDYYHNVRGKAMPGVRRVLDSVVVENTSSTITDQVGFGELFFNSGSPDVNWVPGVDLYRNYDFGGPSVHVGVGSYTRSQLTAFGVADNDISSMLVDKGLQVELFDEDNFQRPLGTFTADQSRFGENGMNDMVTSIRISRIHPTFASKRWNPKGKLTWKDGVITLPGQENTRITILDTRGRLQIVDAVNGLAGAGLLPHGAHIACWNDGAGNRHREGFIVMP